MSKTVLITGAAKRIGASLARTFHKKNFNVVIHYRNSQAEALALCAHLNHTRAHSATAISADLLDIASIPLLIKKSIASWGRLDMLINNASSFFPTYVGSTNEQEVDDLIGSNFKAPFFLVQEAKQELEKQRGTIINIVDIHALRPISNYSIYCAAKAALVSLTKSFAKELAPYVRVNGIAPGTILWPEDETVSEDLQSKILGQIPLKRSGQVDNITKTACFLAENDYITGQIIAVDGGRSI